MRRRRLQTDAYRDYTDSAAAHNGSGGKKTTQPEKTGGVIFFWDGNKLISGGVVRDNLVPPVYVMTLTEEIMTQPKKKVRVQIKLAESSKIGVESFSSVAET